MAKGFEGPGSGKVNSVLGLIEADKLGRTLMHEHFAFGYPGWAADATIAPYDFDGILNINLDVIKKAQRYGIETIVDATTNDVGGRDPLLYKALSEKTGINIICSTGLYTEEEGASLYFKNRASWYREDTAKMISEIFITEITKGIGDTGIKAGVIKLGTGGNDKFSLYEEAVMTAAATAQKSTGVPIITHTTGPSGGIEQGAFLVAAGADPNKTMVGHVSNSGDIEYHKAILKNGVSLGFDRVGLDGITPTETLADIVADLCKQGHAEKIILAHDTVNVWLGRPVPSPERHERIFGNSVIDYISRAFLPALKERGVTEAQIDTMMIKNPKNMFS